MTSRKSVRKNSRKRSKRVTMKNLSRNRQLKIKLASRVAKANEENLVNKDVPVWGNVDGMPGGVRHKKRRNPRVVRGLVLDF